MNGRILGPKQRFGRNPSPKRRAPKAKAAVAKGKAGKPAEETAEKPAERPIEGTASSVRNVRAPSPKQDMRTVAEALGETDQRILDAIIALERLPDKIERQIEYVTGQVLLKAEDPRAWVSDNENALIDRQHRLSRFIGLNAEPEDSPVLRELLEPVVVPPGLFDGIQEAEDEAGDEAEDEPVVQPGLFSGAGQQRKHYDISKVWAIEPAEPAEPAMPTLGSGRQPLGFYNQEHPQPVESMFTEPAVPAPSAGRRRAAIPRLSTPSPTQPTPKKRARTAKGTGDQDEVMVDAAPKNAAPGITTPQNTAPNNAAPNNATSKAEKPKKATNYLEMCPAVVVYRNKSVVPHVSQYVELRCDKCECNGAMANNAFWLGLRGLQRHYMSAHKETPDPKGIMARCNVRTFTTEEVEQIKSGELVIQKRLWKAPKEAQQESQPVISAQQAFQPALLPFFQQFAQGEPPQGHQAIQPEQQRRDEQNLGGVFQEGYQGNQDFQGDFPEFQQQFEQQ